MTISTTRINELKALGYYVEDMGAEHGEEFEGQFRWMNDVTGEFQSSFTSDSMEEAWELADDFQNFVL